MFGMEQSIALLDEVLGEGLDSLVELSGVLSDAVLHLGLGVEGADEDELRGLDDAGATLFLDKQLCTFLR